MDDSINVVERVPFGAVPHAFDLRFNHLVDPHNPETTYLQLTYKFGTDEAHYQTYEVLVRTYKAEEMKTVESTLQA